MTESIGANYVGNDVDDYWIDIGHPVQLDKASREFSSNFNV